MIPISSFKGEKLDAMLILSCLLFPYPAIIQYSTVQKYSEFSVEFNFARAFISAARFENTWPVHSANFENGMETGLNRPLKL